MWQRLWRPWQSLGQAYYNYRHCCLDEFIRSLLLNFRFTPCTCLISGCEASGNPWGRAYYRHCCLNAPTVYVQFLLNFRFTKCLIFGYATWRIWQSTCIYSNVYCCLDASIGSLLVELPVYATCLISGHATWQRLWSHAILGHFHLK